MVSVPWRSSRVKHRLKSRSHALASRSCQGCGLIMSEIVLILLGIQQGWNPPVCLDESIDMLIIFEQAGGIED